MVEAISFDRAMCNQGKNAKFMPSVRDDGTVDTIVSKGPGGVCIIRDDEHAYCAGNGQMHNITMKEEANTLDCMHDKQIVLSEGGQKMNDSGYVVRRLTPLECCRLQGFPDWWTDGVEGSDSAKYKMWGNGMALPCVLYLMQGMERELSKEDNKDV